MIPGRSTGCAAGEFLGLRRRYLQPGLLQARSLGARVLGQGAVQAGWQLPSGQWWIAINVGPVPVAHAVPAGDCVVGPDAAGMLPAGGGVLACWIAA